MRRQQFSTGWQYEFYRDTTSVTAASTRVNFSHDQRKTVAVAVQKLDVSAILSVNYGGLGRVGEHAVGGNRH